jgi:hypothetical protein
VRVRGKDRRTNKRELRNGKNTGDSVKIRSRTVAKTCASREGLSIGESGADGAPGEESPWASDMLARRKESI